MINKAVIPLLLIVLFVPIFALDLSSVTVASVSPADDTYTQELIDTNLNFVFTQTGDKANLSCRLMLQNPSRGIASLGYGINTTVYNTTQTTLSPNATFMTTDYEMWQWNINCTNTTHYATLSAWQDITIDRSVSSTNLRNAGYGLAGFISAITQPLSRFILAFAITTAILHVIRMIVLRVAKNA